MLLLFSTRTAPVLQAIIVQMAPDMLLNFPAHWVHSVTFLVFPMSHNVLLVLGATTVMNLGRLPSLSFVTKDISVVVAQLWQHQITTIHFCQTTLHCFAHLEPSTTPMQGHALLDSTVPLEQQNQRSAHQELLVTRQSCSP